MKYENLKWYACPDCPAGCCSNPCPFLDEEDEEELEPEPVIDDRAWRAFNACMCG